MGKLHVACKYLKNYIMSTRKNITFKIEEEAQDHMRKVAEAKGKSLNMYVESLFYKQTLPVRKKKLKKSLLV